jgi:carbamoyltransferase
MNDGGILAGLTMGTRNGVAALADAHAMLGVCAQERVTRVKRGGTARDGFPQAALDLLLSKGGHDPRDITRTVVAECEGVALQDPAVERLGHHFAHAAVAYLTSSFRSAAIVVCDHDEPQVSVWRGEGAEIAAVSVPWHGPGFSAAFSTVASALGFRGDAADQRMEAAARLRPDSRNEDLAALIRLESGAVVIDGALERRLLEKLAGDRDPGSAVRASLAAALQTRLGDLLVEFLLAVRRDLGLEHLCLGGDLFYHSSLNTMVRRCQTFAEAFVPIDPGNSGLAVGAACAGRGGLPAPVSPFLGPSYSPQEIKEVFDNCKLQYSWESEDGALGAAVEALAQGHLVGWFEGGMEWGPRALGARCILANPLAPYVLENLNRFLKGREAWRGYAFSGLAAGVAEHFDGPATSAFMECDYRPRDPQRFRHALPSLDAAVRVHVVPPDQSSHRFGSLLAAVGLQTGLPFVVNTSFNGYYEPIVCSPRDAVRVFYGSGVDVLIAGRFVVRK